MSGEAEEWVIDEIDIDVDDQGANEELIDITRDDALAEYY